MSEQPSPEHRTLKDRLIWFCLNNKMIVILIAILIVGWGVMVAPFDWDLGGMVRDPVPVDAIPDIGENQQIVFTEWMGRSPRDVEDQITYPLTVSLLGIPGVKTIRSFSMFGFSSIYVIFEEDVEFYWSRSRVLEKLNSLPDGTVPSGVSPALGPDATALGQIFWYTLEGRDKDGEPTGGWDLHELRSIQDWYVRYGLMSASGVSEVASVGGFVQEYQIDVDPDAMHAHGVTLEEIFSAVKMSNLDVGARTIEINKVEYIVRGLGFIENVSDIENTVVQTNENIPVYIKDVANVQLGPALRRGVLDKEGAEAVGGVVVARYGENPLKVIQNVKEKIKEISPGLPEKTLEDGTVSKVKVVPFYDRTDLIYETLGTLNTALSQQIMVTVIVILVTVMHLASSIIISALLPLAVLMIFIAMKMFGVDANIVALSGIAISIGAMVDMGIIVCENILKHLDRADPHENSLQVVFRATSEVGGAVLTAISTTIVSFLPVFTMIAAEGKLFRPLAFTKTFALLASVIVALTVIPPMAHVFFTGKNKKGLLRQVFGAVTIIAGLIIVWFLSWWGGGIIILVGTYRLLEEKIGERTKEWLTKGTIAGLVLIVGYLLTLNWLPLGPEAGVVRNLIFVTTILGGLLLFFYFFQKVYSDILVWCLDNKAAFLSLPLILLLIGAMVWLGSNAFLGWLPNIISNSAPVRILSEQFPGLGKEFMPPLNEGSFLYMPTTMTHASIGEAQDILQMQDRAIRDIPEIKSAVGKIGRAETPLDPAPLSMIETTINYREEYVTDKSGRRQTFRYDPDAIDYQRNLEGEPVAAPDGKPYKVRGKFIRDEENNLIPDPYGQPFRQWRVALDPELNDGRAAWQGVKNPDDIWDEIVDAAQVPGVTSAPKLQPIAARLVMLQSGMRAPMGIKVQGPDLQSIENMALKLEQYLKEVDSVKASAVIADRIVGKPYLEIDIDRKALGRYGIHMKKIQDVIEVAIGGKIQTATVEGRERYPVRVRYPRELRDNIEAINEIYVTAADGTQIPLGQLAEIKYSRGPQAIKSEDTFLTGYVLFDKRDGFAEVDVVEDARLYLEEKIEAGELTVPEGISYTFAGSYENQARSEKRLAVILPVALFIIFMILYLQFKSVPTTLMVFSGIVVAWAGGFILIWFYGQSWFMNFSVFGTNLRQLFQIHPINLSVAIWVGFLALFGIASDNGVVLATYLDQTFKRRRPQTLQQIRSATVEASQRRIRPCLMTTATTILALLPILTSTGRGSDIMVPMAIPSVGGMLVVLITIFVVPVLYSGVEEIKCKWRLGGSYASKTEKKIDEEKAEKDN